MEKYLDAGKKPLEAGKHYLRGSDNQESNPLFYNGEFLIDLNGRKIPIEETAGLFKIQNEDDYVSSLEKKAFSCSHAALFVKINRHRDVTSECMPEEEPLGVDGG